MTSFSRAFHAPDVDIAHFKVNTAHYVSVVNIEQQDTQGSLMHARMISRHLRTNRCINLPRMGMLAVAIIIAQVLLLGWGNRAHADINVAYVTIKHQDGYQVARVYAGRTVPGRASQLGFKQGGEVAHLAVDIGDRVVAGDVLANLDQLALQSDLQQAKAEVALAKANLAVRAADARLAANTEARFAKMKEQGHASQQTYDETRFSLDAKQAQVAVARAQLEQAKAKQQAVEVAISESYIRAPFAGTVQARYFDEGAQVTPGTPVLRLVESNRREAHIGLPSELASTITAGQTFHVRWNETRYPAQLTAVLPEVDDATRTLTAVFSLADQQIPMGAVVELTVDQTVPEPGFWVPVNALTASDRGLWGLYVVDNNSQVERRLVEVIHTEADRVYVRGTLSDNNRVIHTGVQRIVPGQKVTLNESSSTLTSIADAAAGR